VACGEEALRIAETIDRPWALVHAHTGLGIAYLKKGDLDRAIPTLGRAIDVAHSVGMRSHRAGAVGHLGAAYALAGRIPESAALLEEAIAQTTSLGSRWRQAQFTVWLSEVRLRETRIADAADLAARALLLARDHEQRGVEAWVLRFLGEIDSHREPPDIEGSEGHYRQAMSLAAELGMRPVVAHCHLGLGTLYRRVGRRDQAREHLTTATTMYHEMDMRFWLEKAEAEMKGLQG